MDSLRVAVHKGPVYKINKSDNIMYHSIVEYNIVLVVIEIIILSKQTIYYHKIISCSVIVYNVMEYKMFEILHHNHTIKEDRVQAI